jgi:hypothetical protein
MAHLSPTVEADGTRVDRSGVAVLVAHPQYATIPAAGVLLAQCALGFA